MSKRFTIFVDTREKTPLPIPKHLNLLSSYFPTKGSTAIIQTEPLEMVTGDYAVKGHTHKTLVERKGSIRELAKNCLTRAGRRSFTGQLDRLASTCSDPVLLLEGSPSTLLKPSRYVPEPGHAFDAFYGLLVQYGIRWIVAPTDTTKQRSALGELLTRILLNGATNHAC